MSLGSTSLIEILKYRAQYQPDKQAYIFLQNGETESASLTYRELDRRARAIAVHLQSMPGERALLLYPSGLEFITAFFGCLYAGVIAVPVYPPRQNQKLSRLLSIVNDAEAKVALTTTSILADIEKRWIEEAELATVKLIATDTIETPEPEFVPQSVTPESLAFLQYTSGSTGTPKGVIVTHGNIIHNQQSIHQAFGHSEKTIFVGWLPLFHDMGLIGNVLQPIYLGIPSILMPPVAFLQKPICWLKAISNYRATTSGGPNFAYDLCVKKVQPEELVDLDLSSWDVAFNGAEPIRAETLKQFGEKFASYGFNYRAFYPCYGMAETTLFATGGDKNQLPVIQSVLARDLEQNSIVETEISSPLSRVLVGVGRPGMNTTVIIVNPESLTRSREGLVGEIWVSGDSITSGYWNRPQATQETFQAYVKDTGDGPFLRTGDLGFFRNGELFVTGRLKDLIIISGRNHYPQDIELTVENSHPALRSHCSAAFSIEMEDSECLVVACEVERTYLRKLNTLEIVRAIQIAVSTEHELEVYGVVLLKTGSIPKTSSGKIQRRACQIGFLEESLNVVGQWQKNLEKNPTIIGSNSQLNSQDNSFQKPSKTAEEIAAWLVNQIAEILQLSTEKIDLKQPLAVYGLNSVKAVSIAAELEKWLGISIAPTIVYDYPSIQALADYFGQTTPKLESSTFVSNQKTATEAVAIIGMGCRFPKAKNPQAFWSLLRSGVDAITKVPVSRWESGNGWGGFLEQVDQFEPQFFNISPREANNMDPQQRLLLEVSWEALENAGLAAERLAGSRGGVFIGISSGDYAKLNGNIVNTEAYYGTGNALSIAANRLSYFLDWHGPSWAVDTACSSSLVAVHQACQSLLLGECHLALAGGVNLMLSPQLTLTFAEAQMMAADGLCKTFDALADGYVRSEGCGVVVLKRLADALADGDSIQAIIRGTAVNQDGLTNGLTAPNGNSQQEVIRLALAKAGVQPNQISYVETHGTGTSLGDPIEVNSLKAVLMEDRESNQPCWISSVKTNIGHLEAAAGIAGLIKVVLSLEHGEIPPHLHLKQLNPYIELEKTTIEIPTQLQPWSSVGQPRLAGVSAFGFGGTNAHVVLEEAPAQLKSQDALSEGQNPTKLNKLLERPVHLLTLSAKTEKALDDLVENYQNHLETYGQLAIADVCFSANTGRSHFNHRLAIITSDKQELAAKLAKIIAGEELSGVYSGKLSSNSKLPKIAFLFTGQGSQYVNMGRQLYETQPVFRRALDQCEQILQSYLEKSLLEVVYPENPEELNSSVINETAYTQPALFAIEYALFQLWQSWGIKPDVVMGHSVGEYVAAVSAGVFSLEDGLKLIALRGCLMQKLPNGGEMVAVMTSEEKVRSVIEPLGEKVSIAAINGPVSIVISGAADAIHTICHRLESDGIKIEHLQVSHAFHSPLMEPMLTEFENVASSITYNKPCIPIISNLTGEQANVDIATPQYWINHVLKPVKFACGMETLEKIGYEVFLEIGPKPILLGMGRQCFTKNVGVWLPSLRPGRGDWQQILQSLAELYVRGAAVNWSDISWNDHPRKVVLPTYPWQRSRYWLKDTNAFYHKKQLLSRNVTDLKSLHSLLGQRLDLPGLKEIRFESQINQDIPAYLTDHRVFEKPILPATAYLEMVLAAGVTVFKSDNLVLENVVFQQALILPEDELKTLQFILTPEETSSYSFQIFSRNTVEEGGESSWTQHASGKVRLGDKAWQPPMIDLANLQTQYTEEISIEAYYQKFRDQGIDYGSSFQGIETLWKQEGSSVGQIRSIETLVLEPQAYLHPVQLDACFQVLGAAIIDNDHTGAYLPIGIKRLQVYCRPGTHVFSQVQITPVKDGNQQTLQGEVCVYAPDGHVIAKVEGLHLQRTSLEALLKTKQESWQNSLYQVEWRRKVRFASQPLPADYLATPMEIDISLRPQVTELISQQHLQAYGELLKKLEALSVDYVLKAFEVLQWEFQLGRRFVGALIAEQLGIVSQHRQLLERLLEMLAEVGLLQRIDSQWEVIQLPHKPKPQEQLSLLQTQYPEAVAELTLLERCGSNLAQVLRGELKELELLFPEGDLSTTTQLYQDSPGAQVINTVVQKVVKTALEQLPKGRGVRVLEIGAGTGGTTSYILPIQPAEQTEYIFTDLSPWFTTQAQEKFHDYPFVRYQVLDIEQDPQSQGFALHGYDLIIAANVLHATKRLQTTLEYIGSLLAPEGMLVLVEGTAPQRFMDLTFGLTEGWWSFTDRDLRPNYPLLATNQWQDLLQQMGFQAVVTIPSQQDSQGIVSQQAVIIAQVGSSGTNSAISLPKSWLVMADRHGIGQQLATLLRSKGEVCYLVFQGEEYEQLSEQEFRIDTAIGEDFHQILAIVRANHPSLHGVINCWSMDALAAAALTSPDLKAASLQGCGSTLHLIHAIVEVGFSQPPRLWLVTQGAQPVTTTNLNVPGVAQSSLWGMGKVIALEHPELNCVRVDLDPDAVGDQTQDLFEEIWAGDAEDQVAFRNQVRYVARLAACSQPEDSVDGIRLDVPQDQPYRLEISDRGTLENLKLQPTTRNKPSAGEVEIRVQATGLNFRDVLNALDLYPGDPGPLGGECAGTIVAIGEGVEDFEIGTRVVAIAPGSFSKYVTVKADLVARKPEILNFEEAATIPITFLTAYYTLHHLAKISPQDRLLIHAAAGGVGQAAVQLALQAKAEVFATASPKKWEFVKSMGVKHIMNSRTLNFADQIMALTEGKGVDIVLNSLTSEEFIAKSLLVLRPKGRFLEIAKRGVWDSGEILQTRSDVSYFLVDLVLVCQQQSALIQSMLRHLMQQFEEGKLKPLAKKVFPIQNVIEAFRYMQQAKHIGKIVIAQQQGTVDVALRGDSTYLITGGMGGLGLLVARWMVSRGARHLLLVGRSGASPDQASQLTELEQAGAKVIVAQADVSDIQQMTRVLLESEQSLPPLRGIIHSVGVLDDGVLQQLNWERFERVMSPKAIGAWNLHTLTKNQSLDFFVMFSSAASVFGSPGQANHAAANAFLDTLAYYRQTQKLPGLSINWGAVAEVGAAAKRQAGEWVKAKGMGTISTQQVLEVLEEQLFSQSFVQVGVLPVNWSQFREQSALVPFFSDFLQTSDQPKEQRSGFLQQLEAIPANERRAYLLVYVCSQVAIVLGLNPSAPIDPQQGFFDLGMDSLTAVELRNRLQTNLKCSLPSTLTFKYPTIETLVDYLAMFVLFKDPSAQSNQVTQKDTEVQRRDLAEIKQLSQDEIDASIAKEVEELESLLRGN
ncbi:MAG: SDR family NAD(P)-dependent oxidoreductase [Stigonema ocellatum SAG 48.90 = DSM 106950]|nr:SDR family NAD(P)-dependent oxidoreductase [Stigonema ocellatum SAG 48.90 = DSM 106950]